MSSKSNQRFLICCLWATLALTLVLTVQCAPLGGVDEKAFSSFLTIRRPNELGAPSEKDDSKELDKRARQHLDWMEKNAKCNVPQPRVVLVQHEHPDASVSYLPNSVVLHRCAEDSGCCLTENQHCAPISQEEVYLPIRKTFVGKPSISEDMAFVNHTHCACE